MSPTYRKALVIGLGTSGRAAAQLLAALGVEVRAYDQRAEAPTVPAGLKLYLGCSEPPAEAFEGIDLMVLSPGVPPGSFRAACAEHAPQAVIHGELGLALTLLEGPTPRLVLITGTNGKSTVTALVGELLGATGRRVFVGGNLGEPLADRVRACRVDGDDWPQDIVLECSSYQLETLPHVPTDVGILLNITQDHLDRYDSLEHYARTKTAVFQGLAPGGLALLDALNEWTPRLRPDRPGVNVVEVGRERGPRVEGPGSGRSLIVPPDEPYPRSLLGLPARHNARNAVFALAAARHLGVDSATCRAALSRFEGLPHRMRMVRELGGVRFYNDSKATNVASAVAGLGGLDERFVLIAGGRGKGDDLTPLRTLLQARGRGLVAIGETAKQFHALGEPSLPAAMAQDMTQAVELARAMAQPGDAVVLAPACASFDQYRSYAQRGEAFIAAVAALTE